MPASLIIPSIFTAIDKFSAPLKNMIRNTEAFAAKTETGVARGERMFRKLTPALSGAAKEFLSFASAAAISSAIVGGVAFSTKSIMDYETALASFRTIVSNLTDKEFSEFQTKINEVASSTRKSSVDVAASFEKIAGLNADFAATADGLSAVSKAAIILAKASGEELGTSAENLVGIMNQFSMGALEADRAINVLAAGQAVGAANISQTAESFKNFGSVASGANITLEQSVGLIQTLGKFSVFGAEAGTKLRGSVLKLQQAGVGYKSGQFQINDALEEAKKKIDRLKTAKQQDAALTKMFGAENIATGRILLSNIEVYKKYAEGVTGTNEAQKAADINSKTLAVALDELKNSWVNMITSSDRAGSVLSGVKNVISFLTENLDTIVSVGVNVLTFFAVWKGLLIATRAALFVYNVYLGVTGALSGVASIAIGASSVALGAYNVVMWIAAAATGAWAFAMSIGLLPLTLIALGIGILIAIIYSVVASLKGWGEQWDSITSFISLSTEAFVAGLKVYFGTIYHAFMLMVDGIVIAWKWGQNMIGNISDEQFAKDKAKILNEQKLRVKSIEDNARLALSKAEEASKALEFKLKFKTADDVKAEEAAAEAKPAINPKLSEQDALVQKMEKTNNSNVVVDFKNVPKGVDVSGDGMNSIAPKLSSTLSF